MSTTGPGVARPRGVALLREPKYALITVAALYVLVDLIVVAPHAALNADESLYASEVNPRVPAQFVSAPRARGITYLLAPIVHVTSSTTALRAYLAVVAGIALVAAFWPWLRALRPPALAPIAAACFAGLWAAQFYGAAAWPNAWVGFAAIWTTGWFVRFGQERHWLPLLWIAGGSAALMLLRPSDGVLVLLPLFLAFLLFRRWRRPMLFVALAGGALLGLAQWIIEANHRFGGVANRLHEASKEQGGLGWHPNGLLYSLRALPGPALCRPCTQHVNVLAHPSVTLITAWWLLMPVLVVGGLVVARRTGQLAELAVPTASGLALALSYLLTVDYAAPRFLVPTYGLFALPIAAALGALLRGLSRRPHGIGRTLTAAIAIILAAVLAAQLRVLAHQANLQVASPYAVRALRAAGVAQPCVVGGLHAAQVAYQLGCRTAYVGHLIRASARHGRPVMLTKTEPQRIWRRFACWEVIPLGHPRKEAAWWAYVRPLGAPHRCSSRAASG